MDVTRFSAGGGETDMTRQILCRGLVSATLVIGSMGCETTRSFLHHDKDDDAASKQDKDSDDDAKPKSVSSEASKIRSVDSDDKNPQPFFKSNRSSLGWSSEAREIEADLGVH
jgi:hypothetical protein